MKLFKIQVIRRFFLVLLICLPQLLLAKADTSLLKTHLEAITKTPTFRNYQNIQQLNKTAAYIEKTFREYSDSVSIQEYEVEGRLYRNVICSFGTQHQERIVVGAHYDVCEEQEGADDNASGVAGLLELARMLQTQKLSHRIDLVAYTLEEPPYFRTEHMGSYVHAQSLSSSNVKVLGMVSLEMIGYFSDQPKSQTYPLGVLSLFYGKKGDYITLVRKWGSGSFARKFCRKYKRAHTINTKKFSGPKALPGIDFSDHLNYWHFGFSALMITDTSFYRNENYHKVTDTMATLDITRMAKVIDGVLAALAAI